MIHIYLYTLQIYIYIYIYICICIIYIYIYIYIYIMIYKLLVNATGGILEKVINKNPDPVKLELDNLQSY